MSHVNPLTREGEIYLARKIEAGDQAARNEMIEANLHVVASIAKKYRNRGVELEDLIQEGNLGLYRATESFDWRLGFRFGTHAQWWIRKRISTAVRNNTPLRTPRSHDKYTTAVRRQRELHTELGREPDERELAADLDVTQERLGAIMKSERHAHCVSLDSSPGNAGGSHSTSHQTPLRELIADPDQESAEQTLERKEATRTVDELLSKLQPREERVLRMRYGIGGHADLELTAIEIPESSREFISWVEQRALKRLRESLQ